MKGPIKRTFERAGQIPTPWSDSQDQRPWVWCRRSLAEIYAPTADGAALFVALNHCYFFSHIQREKVIMLDLLAKFCARPFW